MSEFVKCVSSFFGGRREEERRGIVDLRPRNTRD